MRVRPAIRADIPALVRLRSRAFRRTAQPTTAAAEAYFARVLFDHPWRDDALPSLVCEDDAGGVRGFIGLLTRPMVLGGRAVRMGVPTQLMADPEAGGMVGIRLLKAVFAGSHDLLFSDAANDTARRVWEGVGGVTAHLLSCRWALPLRPLRAAATRRGDGWAWRVVRLGLLPVTTVGDAVLRRRHAAAPPDADLALQPFEPAVALAAWARVAARRPLAPRYDAASLGWLLERAAERCGPGDWSARAVVASGETIGWFIGFLDAGRFELLQFAAQPGRAGDVLAAARCEAMRTRALVLSCRYDATQAAEWTASGARLERAGPWVLLSSRDPALERAVLLGDAWLSRLEGETWLNF